jgi:hypothetical protein
VLILTTFDSDEYVFEALRAAVILAYETGLVAADQR